MTAVTLGITSTGQLQPLRNSPDLTAGSVSAQFCDGSTIGPINLFANLHYDTPPPHIPTAPNALSVCGEVLHVLRPVVYVGALLRASGSFHPSGSNS